MLRIPRPLRRLRLLFLRLPMEVATLSTTERPPALRWTVLTIIVFSQFQIQLVTLPPLASPIIANLQLTRTEFGLIMSALNITIVICQPLGSVLVDRAGLKLDLFLGIAGWLSVRPLRWVFTAWDFLFSPEFFLAGYTWSKCEDRMPNWQPQ